MNKVSLTLSFEKEKLEAMEIFLKKADSSTQRKMEEALNKLYEETVPEPVREYIDSKVGGKPKRPSSPPKPKSDPKPKTESKKEASLNEQP